MLYKTYANNVQIFGDDACYPEWIDFIQSQGIAVDDENHYEGDITDFMAAVDVIESILKRLHKEREELRDTMPDTTKKCLFDLSYIPNEVDAQEENKKLKPKYYLSFLDLLMQATEQAYCFFPYHFYMACNGVLEPDKPFARPGHLKCWKLKDGMKIHVRAAKEDRQVNIIIGKCLFVYHSLTPNTKILRADAEKHIRTRAKFFAPMPSPIGVISPLHILYFGLASIFFKGERK